MRNGTILPLYFTKRGSRIIDGGNLRHYLVHSRSNPVPVPCPVRQWVRMQGINSCVQPPIEHNAKWKSPVSDLAVVFSCQGAVRD